MKHEEKNFNNDIRRNNVLAWLFSRFNFLSVRLFRRSFWILGLFTIGALGTLILPSHVLADADTLAENQEGGIQLTGAGTAPEYHGQIFQVTEFGYATEINFYAIRNAINDVNIFALFNRDGSVLASTTITNATTTDGTQIWTLSTPIYVAPNRNYFLGQQNVSGSGIAFAGSSTNAYADGCEVRSGISPGPYTAGTSLVGWDCSTNNGDIIFEVSGSPLQTTIGIGTSTIEEYSNCRSTLTFTNFFSSSSLEAFGCILFIPDPDTLIFANEQIHKFDDIFPFNILFQFNEVARYALENYSATDSTISFPILFPSGSTTFVFVSSSTVTSVVGSEAKNAWFDFQKYLMWIIVAWLALKTIVPSIKKRK